MMTPNLGDRVVIWPTPGASVQDGAGRFGVFLDGRREVVWDEYWHRRFLDGAVLFHDPTPPKATKTDRHGGDKE